MGREPSNSTLTPTDDPEAYQVDLATTLFTLMLITFVATMAQQQATPAPPTNSDYRIEDRDGEPFPLSSFRAVYRFYDYWVWRNGQLTRLELRYFATALTGSADSFVTGPPEAPTFALAVGQDTAPSSFSLQLTVKDGAALPEEWTFSTIEVESAGGPDAITQMLVGSGSMPHLYIWPDQLPQSAVVLDGMRRRGWSFRYEVVRNGIMMLSRDPAQFGLEGMAR